jgi:glycosyltransferase involved in cell wall biosynthesis
VELKERADGEPRIQFCGPMTDDNRVTAFASFDVLAIPSTRQETGPYTVLEAFAADLSVLGINHSGIRERVVDGTAGVLFQSASVTALTNPLHRLYEHSRTST